jgi:glycerol uptake facilitator-like aquaporin
MRSLRQRAVCEWLGTAFLLAAIVGSGIMAERLAGGNAALALLCNTLPTGAMLTVLILVYGPVSGAHFNPVVSVAMALRSDLPWPTALLYILAQVQWLAEAVATFGLVVTILGCAARAPASVAYAVGLYITSAYWFTASTSFANPAVTIARSLTDTFAGIAPAGVTPFVVAQFAGMLAAVVLNRWLSQPPSKAPA